MTLLLAGLAVMLLGACAGALLPPESAAARRVTIAALLLGAAPAAYLGARVLAGLAVPDLILPWTLPASSFHLGLDALSSCFLLLILAVGVAAGVYGEGYIAASHGHVPARPVRFFFILLVASMALLVSARNAVLFLVAWEVMALSAFFLVAAEHRNPRSGRAALIYLLCTHCGSLCLLALFALLGRRAGSLEFSAFAALAPLPPAALWAALALALAGFGMKAGFLPLHVWLQEAHPAAPSHASAAMSGVMIEMGLYGLLRLFSLLPGVPRGAAVALVALGLATALYGILFAAVQQDLKRLLAYSSIENVGIILAAMGLGWLGLADHNPAQAVLGFSAAILHTVNHGLFKSLLFLSAGAFYQALGTRDLEAGGGLVSRMPALCALSWIGAAAICALPPFNGFLGEWLVYSWLLRPDTGHDIRLTSLAAAVLSLVGALAVVAFTRGFGLLTLGRPRTPAAAKAREPRALMLVPMAALAAPCALIGVWPGPALRAAFAAGAVAARAAAVAGSAEEWTHVLRVIGAVGAGCWLLCGLFWAFRSALLRRRSVERGPTWGCGFTAASARMQYSASSFAGPAALPFTAALAVEESVVEPAGYWPARPSSYASRTPDPALDRVLPRLLAKAEEWLSAPRRLRGAHLQVHLFYVSAFLVAILLWKL